MNSGRGDFYVRQGCCFSCGVPQAIAPTLVGWRDQQNLHECYWIRQPRNSGEVEQAIRIIHTQELDCHRYSGRDAKIIRRLPPAQCDHPSIGPFDSIWRRVYGWYQLYRLGC